MINRRALLGAVLAAVTAVSLTPSLLTAADPILLRDLYNRDMSFSDLALANEDQRVSVQGYMAPPLKAEAAFFVLTKMPMAVCPFCEAEADWPADIVLVLTRGVMTSIPFNLPIEVEGMLSLGTEVDEETGFVSRVRLVDATFRRL